MTKIENREIKEIIYDAVNDYFAHAIRGNVINDDGEKYIDRLREFADSRDEVIKYLNENLK